MSRPPLLARRGERAYRRFILHRPRLQNSSTREDSCESVCCCHHSSRSEEHTSELQSQSNLVCRLLLEKKNCWNRALLPNVMNLRRCYADEATLCLLVACLGE